MAATLKLGTDGNWATKEGSLLAYNDENNNIKPLPFDFTRASSATRVNKQGLIETVASGVPRIDFTDANGALKLEPQRTNTAFPSESFSGYIGSASTIVSNQATSPDGYANADLIYPSVSGNFAGKYKTLAPSTTGVVSCFVKQAGKRYAIVGTDNNATYTCIFDLQTATVVYEATNYTGKIEAFANGWYRVSAAYSASTAANYPFIGLADDAAGAVTVDGTNGLYIWGFQYETGASYATSYIPTQGSAVTRLAESNVLATTISLDSDFCLFWEGAVFEDDVMLYGSGGNLAWYMNYLNSTGRIILDESSGRKVEAYISPSIPTNVKTKILIRRVGGVHNVFANGVKLTNTVSVDSTTTLSLVSMFWSYSSTFYKGLEVNQSQVFKTSLTDSEAIALTTI
jgi:hypothetical protein